MFQIHFFPTPDKDISKIEVCGDLEEAKKFNINEKIKIGELFSDYDCRFVVITDPVDYCLDRFET